MTENLSIKDMSKEEKDVFLKMLLPFGKLSEKDNVVTFDFDIDVIKQCFSDWNEIETESWSNHGIVSRYGSEKWDFFELGLYKDAEKDSDMKNPYSLMCFWGEEVFFDIHISF